MPRIVNPIAQSLMNQPTPPFNGAATALYGPRGPQRALEDRGRARKGHWSGIFITGRKPPEAQIWFAEADLEDEEIEL